MSRMQIGECMTLPLLLFQFFAGGIGVLAQNPPPANALPLITSPQPESSDLGVISPGTNLWVRADTNSADARVLTRGEVVSIDSTNRISLLTGNGRVTLLGAATNDLFPGIILDATGIPLTDASSPTLATGSHRRVGIAATYGLTNASTDRASSLPTLGFVYQIRRLSEAEAQRGYPVRLRGGIPYADPTWGLYFFQGATEGIYLNTLNSRPEVEAGDLVAVSGFTASTFARDIT